MGLLSFVSHGLVVGEAFASPVVLLQPREFADLVVQLIRHWNPSGEWQEPVVWWLPLGAEVAACRPWSRPIFDNLTRWKLVFERELN
jgi:hypothetical protein